MKGTKGTTDGSTLIGALNPSSVPTALNVDGSGNLKVTGGGGGSGGAATIADGADIAEGATTDAAVVGDNAGTVSAKLRGLTKIFNDVWDSTNHRLNIFIQALSVNVGTPTASAISVGVTSTAVVTPGANAKLLILINDSPNTMYLNISGGAATLNAGVRLNANGGSIMFDRYVPTAAITAISSVAASNLLVEVG